MRLNKTHALPPHTVTPHTFTHITAHSCEVDLKSLKPEVTHDMKLPLKGADRLDAGAIHVLLVITGTSVEEEEEDGDGREEHDINMSDVRRRYVSGRRGRGEGRYLCGGSIW